MSLARGLYRFATFAAGPALGPWLRRRVRAGKEDAARLDERKGVAALARPPGKLVWFHGASVGECLSLLPLVSAVREQGHAVLVTSGTVTSAALLAERLPQGAIHQFIPLDHPAWTGRFLDHWQPNLVLWAESELWPNMLGAVAARGLTAVLVNGRLSDRSFQGWRRWRGFAGEVLSAFRLVLAQSPEDRDRFKALGAREARVSGNIKLASPPLPADPAAVAVLKQAIGARPHWLGASIHPGEDAIAARVHLDLKAKHPGLLTLLVPRHPQRGPEMAAGARALGLTVALRSAGGALAPDTDIYIADTMGELGLFFRASEIVFMGKSLAVGGGQNPAEPAHFGCAIVLGPDMSNFRDLSATLVNSGAALQVADAGGLTHTVSRLLADPGTRAAMGAAGRGLMAGAAGAVMETLRQIEPYVGSGQIR